MDKESSIFDKAKAVRQSIADADPQTAEELEAFRITYIGSKGKVKELFGAIKDIPAESKKAYGQLINEIKQEAEEKHRQLQQKLKKQDSNAASLQDLTLPGAPVELGAQHPISIVRELMIAVFARIGFVISEGPEIVDDWHNFTALNMPEHHPARDMQDTYFVSKDPDRVLRTHTSSVQVEVMQNQQPPIRTISPGRVYRNETISARAHCQFHQVEGLYVDEEVSFADLKQTLYYFAQEMFGEDTQIRFRPSYFPFTEPSAEMDISCLICKGKGCPVCKNTGWVEILGCGMVDPAVLDNCKIDSEKYTGFAFGIGVERIAMLKYQIKDIRLFFENDVRFLQQFEAAL